MPEDNFSNSSAKAANAYTQTALSFFGAVVISAFIDGVSATPSPSPSPASQFDGINLGGAVIASALALGMAVTAGTVYFFSKNKECRKKYCGNETDPSTDEENPLTINHLSPDERTSLKKGLSCSHPH